MIALQQLAHGTPKQPDKAVLTPGIVLAISGRGEVLGQVGSILAVVTMAIFLFTILRHGGGEEIKQNARPGQRKSQPAE